MRIKLEYENEIPQLRRANIWCISCNEKFNALEHGRGRLGERLHDYIDLKWGVYECPHCGVKFKAEDYDIEMLEI